MIKKDPPTNHEDFIETYKKISSRANRQQHTPNLHQTSRRARKLHRKLEEQNGHSNFDNLHDKVAADVQAFYRNLSQTFFHPSADTLRKHHWQGGICENDDSKNASIYNLLLLNSVLKWNISTVKAFQKILKPSDLNDENSTQTNNQNNAHLTLEPNVAKMISSLNEIISEYVEYYEEEIVKKGSFNHSNQDFQLNKLHKFYIHSSAAIHHFQQINLDAYCVELSIMSDMLDDKSHLQGKRSLDENLIRNFKHPLSCHSAFTVSEGGIQFDSINQKATFLIVLCLYRHQHYWSLVMLELHDKANEDDKKGILKKVGNLQNKAKCLEDTISKLVEKYGINQ